MSVGGSKQIATVECLKVVGKAEVGAQEAGRRLPGVTEQNSSFCCLPVFWKIPGGSASLVAVGRASSFMCVCFFVLRRKEQDKLP